LDKKGPIYARDIVLSGGVEILNPDLVICNIEDSKVNLNMEMVVECGAGYLLADVKKEPEKEISVIFLDALFNPVKRVTYTVENARIGQQTDYDKLIMEVETNGIISPENALGIAAKILQTQLEVFVEFDYSGDADKSPINEDNVVISSNMNSNLSRKIDELELSVRSYNCLLGEDIHYVGDLVRKSEADMLKLPNFGKKSLNELKENLKVMGLSFDMKLSEDWKPMDQISKKKKKE
jgi:DNA-directed RNA polymerase subunit alpha